MSDIAALVADNLDIWTGAIERKSGAGRSGGKRISLYGIARLRALILDLAMRGKLVPQDARDEPASELLKTLTAQNRKFSGATKKNRVIGNDPQPFPLPQGWLWTRLGTLAELITSGSRDWGKYLSNDGAKFVTMGNLSRGSYALRLDKMHFVRIGSNREGTRTSLQAGDLLISITGDVGNMALIPEGFGEAYINQHTAMIRFPPSIQGRFVPEVLRSPLAQRQFNAPQRGVKNSFRLSDIQDIQVPLPPVAEQRRIVAKVDELMALCDALERESAGAMAAHQALVEILLATLVKSADATDLVRDWARLERHFDTLFTTDASIDALKQTILELAMRGKLVKQDAHDEPAAALISALSAEKRKKSSLTKQRQGHLNDQEPFSAPRGWVWTRLGELSELITSGSRDWSKYLSDTGAKFVTMGNLSRGSYEIRLNKMHFVKIGNTREGMRTSLQSGDILVSITGDVGNMAMIPKDFGEAYINQHTAMIRLLPAIRGRYVAEVLRSPLAQKQFNEPQRGIKNSFRLSDVQNILIPIPPLVEQQRIVAKVDALMALCGALKARLADAAQTQRDLADAITQRAAA